MHTQLAMPNPRPNGFLGTVSLDFSCSITAISLLILKVRDLQASHRFYHGLLGLEALEKKEHVWTYRLSVHDFCLGLVAVGHDAPSANPRGVGVMQFRFSVSSAQALLALNRRCKKIDLEVFDTRQDGAITSFCVSDPDGNFVELAVAS